MSELQSGWAVVCGSRILGPIVADRAALSGEPIPDGARIGRVARLDEWGNWGVAGSRNGGELPWIGDEE